MLLPCISKGQQKGVHMDMGSSFGWFCFIVFGAVLLLLIAMANAAANKDEEDR